MRKALVSFYLFIVSSIILAYVFGNAFTVSLFEPGKTYVTKTSILLVCVFIISFIGIWVGARKYSTCKVDDKFRIVLALIGNTSYLILVFLMLLMGVLIV